MATGNLSYKPPFAKTRKPAPRHRAGRHPHRLQWNHPDTATRRHELRTAKPATGKETDVTSLHETVGISRGGGRSSGVGEL